MTAVRQDAWSPDDDLILAEVTLRHIREGSTQLSAFEEVGERIAERQQPAGSDGTVASANGMRMPSRWRSSKGKNVIICASSLFRLSRMYPQSQWSKSSNRMKKN